MIASAPETPPITGGAAAKLAALLCSISGGRMFAAGSAANTRPARGIRPRVPVTRFWLPALALFAGMAQKADHRNRNEELPLPGPAVRTARGGVAIHAGGD